jgi:hypothetical protein
VISSVLNVRGIETFLTHELTQFPEISENSWFQLDEATSRTATNSIDAVNRPGKNHFLSRNGDFFFGQLCRPICWLVALRFEASYATEVAFVTRRAAELKLRVGEEIARVLLCTLQRIMADMRFRREQCLRKCAWHLEDDVCKK